MNIRELKNAYDGIPGKIDGNYVSRGAPLPDSSDTVPFGKHKGESITALLDDIKYVGWMCKQEGMIEDTLKRFPLFGAALVSAVGTGAPALTKQEKAQKRAELKKQAEERRAERASTAEKRSTVPFYRLPRIYELATEVTPAQLQSATPGQRYLHELVMEAYKRSVEILNAVPADASESDQEAAIGRARALWRDLPSPSEWWFVKNPVLQQRKRVPKKAKSFTQRILECQRKQRIPLNVQMIIPPNAHL
jgi:hypothetical protein